jgi:hypothetical protein
MDSWTAWKSYWWDVTTASFNWAVDIWPWQTVLFGVVIVAITTGVFWKLGRYDEVKNIAIGFAVSLGVSIVAFVLFVFLVGPFLHSEGAKAKLTELETKASKQAQSQAELVPEILFSSWDVIGKSCTADIDSSRVSTELRNKYDVVLACGVVDSYLDSVRDSRISISGPYGLNKYVSIAVAFTDALSEGIQKVVERLARDSRAPKGAVIGVRYTIWMQAVLIPKDFPIDKYKTLKDIQENGGRLSMFAGKDRRGEWKIE